MLVRWPLVFAVLVVNLAIQLPVRRTPTALSLLPAASALSKQPPAYVVRVYGFPCYRTVEETYASLVGLASNHPTLASWLDVGDSWQKVTSAGAAGYDLNVLVLTNKARPGPKPAFFLMAAIHAREYSTAEVATRFAEYLVSAYGLDPDVTWLLDYFQVVIMPQANPDGRKLAETGLYQRKNVNNSNGGACSIPATIGNQFGTDLNRR
jgi:carboxypeptidase T